MKIAKVIVASFLIRIEIIAFIISGTDPNQVMEARWMGIKA